MSELSKKINEVMIAGRNIAKNCRVSNFDNSLTILFVLGIQFVLILQAKDMASTASYADCLNFILFINLLLIGITAVLRHSIGYLMGGVLYVIAITSIWILESDLKRELGGADIYLALSSNWQESSEFIVGNGILSLILLSVSAIVAAIYSSKKLTAGHVKSLSRTMMGLVFLYLLTIPLMSMGGASYVASTVISNIAVAMTLNEQDYKQRKEFKFEAVNSLNSADIVVLVVGESARFDRFGINGYRRNTTPNLNGVEQIISLTDMSSAANVTYNSVPIMLSRATPNDFRIAFKEHSIAKLFEQAGYFTAWVSLQESKVYEPDAMEVDSLKDDWHHAKSESDLFRHSDDYLSYSLAKLMQNHKQDKLFVILHMVGSHYQYDSRYNNKIFGRFRPAIFDLPVDPASLFLGINKNATKRELDNSYDNTILHTDAVLGNIVGQLRRYSKSAVMFFTSDHGENLWDDNRKLLYHAGTQVSQYDLHVPFIVYGNAPFIENFKSRYATLAYNKDKPVSGVNVFHTVAGLSGIHYEGEDSASDISSDLFQVKERFYLGTERQLYKLPKYVSLAQSGL